MAELIKTVTTVGIFYVPGINLLLYTMQIHLHLMLALGGEYYYGLHFTGGTSTLLRVTHLVGDEAGMPVPLPGVCSLPHCAVSPGKSVTFWALQTGIVCGRQHN